MKRATAEMFNGGDYTKISIHALVKRATFMALATDISYFISIHALVKRATIARISVSLS